jgi:hypothetical protein
MKSVPHGKPRIVIMPVIEAGAQNYGTGLTLAAGDVQWLSDSQPLTNVLARSIEFTSGSEEPKLYDVIVGATSGDRASYIGSALSGGTWGGADAAGELFLGALDSAAIPAFQSENLNIEGGTSNVMTIGAALKAAGIVAEIGTSKFHAIGITGTELETAKAILSFIDATATEEWEEDSQELETYGNPLASDARGVRWAGTVGLNNLLTFAGLAVNTQTIVIGGKTYTTQDSLTDVDGNVDIPGTAEECAVNVACAIEICEAIAFTSMSELPSVGDTLSGDTSTETCVVTAIFITSGTISGGDAAGWLLVNTLSGAFQSETLTNDTTTTANVATIGADFTGPGSRYAASMTAHTLVKAAPTNGAVCLIYTKDSMIPQRVPCTETQTNASWANAAMQANIASDGTTVDLPDGTNAESPANDDEANDHFIEIVDENSNSVEGYINDVDVAGGTFYGGLTAEAGGFDIGAVRLTIKTGSVFRLDLTGSAILDYAIMSEREIPSRVQSKLSTLPLSTTEKTDAAAAIWDAARSAHVTSGSMGESYSGIVSGEAEAGTLSTTQMSTDLTEATDDHYKNRSVVWITGVLAGQGAAITAYTGVGGILDFAAVTEAPSATDRFVIV